MAIALGNIERLKPIRKIKNQNIKYPRLQKSLQLQKSTRKTNQPTVLVLSNCQIFWGTARSSKSYQRLRGWVIGISGGLLFHRTGIATEKAPGSRKTILLNKKGPELAHPLSSAWASKNN